MDATFSCSLAEHGKRFSHVWEHTVGSGHATLALRADWREQLARCHRELGFEHVRFHGCLSDDMGTLVCERNVRLDSFFNVDSVWDFLLVAGMRPFVELSFMPTTLSSGDTTVFKYRGNVTPPRDYGEWGRFIGRLAGHWLERYGAAEVRKWYFEVWNEPNLPAFWTGGQEGYFRLYRETAAALKGADPGLRVGGPASAKNEWLKDLLAFGARERSPVDFLSTHHYPTDAFGKPGDDTVTQLAESRRSVLRDEAAAARREAGELPLYYTEWNTSSNPRDPLHDRPYAAAFVAKTVMEAADLVDGYSFWTFSDLFEENFFPAEPFHGGFGLLTIDGVPKPTYRAFELLHELGDERLAMTGEHPTVDAWALRRAGEVTVLLTNSALPRHPIGPASVAIRLTGAAPPMATAVRRIDDDHANPRRLWEEEMGCPSHLRRADVLRLDAASSVPSAPLPWSYEDGAIELRLTLPPQSVAAIAVTLPERAACRAA
jgi:xylan 1,4-beta-xylosidase